MFYLVSIIMFNPVYVMLIVISYSLVSCTDICADINRVDVIYVHSNSLGKFFEDSVQDIKIRIALATP